MAGTEAAGLRPLFGRQQRQSCCFLGGHCGSTLGASLAVYGLVLAVLGAPGWGYVLFVLCLVQGMHLMIRWPDYERAAESDTYQP